MCLYLCCPYFRGSPLLGLWIKWRLQEAPTLHSLLMWIVPVGVCQTVVSEPPSHTVCVVRSGPIDSSQTHHPPTSDPVDGVCRSTDQSIRPSIFGLRPEDPTPIRQESLCGPCGEVTSGRVYLLPNRDRSHGSLHRLHR